MESLVQEVRHALRRLRGTPAFTLAAIATLALGIGANSAIFTVVNAVLLRPLPFAQPERLYSIWTRHNSTDRFPFQLPEFCDYRDQNRTLEAVAGFAGWSPNLTGDGEAERLPGLRVSANFFETLGVHAALGRTLRPADDAPGSAKIVVLAHGLWQRRFGGDAAIVGRSLLLNGEPHSVVGVLRPDFLFPVRDVALAVPLVPESDPWRHNRTSTNFIRVVARARAGATAVRITDDLEAVGRRLQQEFPDSYAAKKGVLAVPLHEELTRAFGPTLWMLLAAVALLLLIACANLANLMLVRASAQRRELAIRQALGATRASLGRRLLVESGVLALAGAALGLLLARWCVPVLVALSPAALPRAQEIRISLAVLGFTLVAAVLAALLFGCVPALRAARALPGASLRSEGRAATGAWERGRARGLIVSGQVALMVVLLTGAGLLLRSFLVLARVDAGFDPGVLTLRLSLPRKDYGELSRVSELYRRLEARVAALPGVVSVAAVNHVPMNGALSSADYKLADRPPESESTLPTAQYRMVTPAYFGTLGIPLIAGRAFGDDDREGGAPVAIVSQALARRSFPDRSPIGQHLLVKDNPGGFRSLEVVGLVGDVKHASLEADADPHLYVPYHQTHRDLLVWLTLNQYLVVRSAAPPLALADGIARELRALDPNVAVADVRASGHYVEAAAAPRRFSLQLLACFAGVALALAAVGIYGVASYAVSQRRREIGVRLALGARLADVVGLVLRDGMRRTALGAAVGLAAAAAIGRGLQGLLYGVRPVDVPTYAAVVALLAAVTLLACLAPALRAGRVDPLEALRLD